MSSGISAKYEALIDRERQQTRHVCQHQPAEGIDQSQIVKEQKQRDDENHRWDHAAEEEPAAEERAAWEAATRERVPGWNTQQQRRTGRQPGDDDRVQQRLEIVVVDELTKLLNVVGDRSSGGTAAASTAA